MPNNAPYIGGSSPGAQLFVVDGDFSVDEPCSLPEISYPLRGDSVLSLNNLVVLDIPSGNYAWFPLGSYPNIHPWNANQQAAVLEQDFIVAFSSYVPMRLNSKYNTDWALGAGLDYAWIGAFKDGTPTEMINQFYLVEEGELKDIGGGLVKLRRKFATLPPTRCEIEQFAFTFPGLDDSESGGTTTRLPFTDNVQSRIQYDYFIIDFMDILDLPVFNSDSGRRLNESTGIYLNGIILRKMEYFQPGSSLNSSNGLFIGSTLNDPVTLTDGSLDGSNPGSIPSATDWINWSTGVFAGGISLGGGGSSTDQPAEIVAESSTFTRWLGNIWERRTRFVFAQ